jgi:hypothetical protein
MIAVRERSTKMRRVAVVISVVAVLGLLVFASEALAQAAPAGGSTQAPKTMPSPQGMGPGMMAPGGQAQGQAMPCPQGMYHCQLWQGRAAPGPQGMGPGMMGPGTAGPGGMGWSSEMMQQHRAEMQKLMQEHRAEMQKLMQEHRAGIEQLRKDHREMLQSGQR